ncbi:MAG: extracellular solute-binding protein [Lachnospiraceae bacterium]|nr:extracellular solute-binding protein [Lachnospiraceae bacterium]
MTKTGKCFFGAVVSFSFLMVMAFLIMGCGRTGGRTGASETVDEAALVLPANGEYVYVAENVTQNFKDSFGVFVKGVLPDGSVWGIDEEGNIVGAENEISALTENETEDLDRCEIWIGEDTIVAARDDTVSFFDKDGRNKGNAIIADGYIEDIADGWILYHTTGNERVYTEVCRLDVPRQKVGEKPGDISGNINGLFESGSDENFLYYYDSNGAYLYSVKEDKSYTIFLWIDLGVDNITECWKTGDDFFAACFKTDKGGEDIYRITLRRKDELPERKEIVIASPGVALSVKATVTDFNNSQDKIRVTIKDYSNNSDIEAAGLRLQADVLSENAPDILSVYNNESLMISLARQGGFVNLRTFLDADDEMSEDDYYPEVLKMGTYKDTLYMIPKTFALHSLIIPGDERPADGEWTMDSLLDYIDKYPEATFWCRHSADDIFYWSYFFFRNITDYFVNEETGDCHFESEEFKRLLTKVKEMSMKDNSEDMSLYNSFEVYDDDGRRAFCREMFENHKWLAEWGSVFSLNEIYDLRQSLGEDICFGYFPTGDGTGKTVIDWGWDPDGLAILESSDNKEEAWEFIRYFLMLEPKWSDFELHSNKKHISS